MNNIVNTEKMKQIKIFGLLLAFASIFFACTDLEEEPVGLLAPESMFQTSTDVETAIMGAYGRMATEKYYGRKLVLTLQLLSDMSDIGNLGTPSRRQDINNFNSDATNGMITSIWPLSYEIISAANAAIDGSDRVTGNEEQLNALRGEARFIRGFIYYHLVRLFGEVPYIDEFVTDPSALIDISKTSVNEIYAGIIEDFEYAKAHLPNLQPNGTRTRPSKGTAAGYLASVALTLKDYSKAAQEAEWVINNSGDFNVSLMLDYQDCFDATQATGLKEHLFAVDFAAAHNAGGGQGVDWMGPVTGISGSDDRGWSVSVPSLAVYNSWDDRDYRKSVAFQPTALVGGVEIPYTDPAFSNLNVYRPHIAKFRRFPGDNRGDGGLSDTNYSGMRYAEVLLIAAEALNETSGPTSRALNYINQIRARARNAAGTLNSFPADVLSSISTDDFRDLIIEERRLELSFEFKRWYDIKRLGIGNDVFNGSNSLESHSNFDPSRDYLLALPQSELDINPNLLPQNNGY